MMYTNCLVLQANTVLVGRHNRRIKHLTLLPSTTMQMVAFDIPSVDKSTRVREVQRSVELMETDFRAVWFVDLSKWEGRLEVFFL